MTIITKKSEAELRQEQAGIATAPANATLLRPPTTDKRVDSILALVRDQATQIAAIKATLMNAGMMARPEPEPEPEADAPADTSDQGKA